MKISEFRGFKQVFLFEFMTGVKKTSFKVFLAILCAIAFFPMPIKAILGNMKGDNNAADGTVQKSEIETVYVYNETDIPLDYDAFTRREEYTDVSFVTDAGMSYSDCVTWLKSASDHKDIVVKLEYDQEDGFDVDMVHSDKSGIKNDSLGSFQEDFSDFLREEVLRTSGVSSEEYDYMSKDIEVTVMKTNKEGAFVEDEGSISTDSYFWMLGGLMILFFLVNMAAGNVATSVATEKSSRVIEYLLTGTRPLALLSGKIAAKILETVVIAFASFSSFFMSQIVTTILVANTVVTEGASDNVIVVASIWETITISKLVIALVYFVLGLCLFSILAALAGASVSKFDELQEAYQTFTLILVVSVYTDLFLVIMMLISGDTQALMNFCSLCPLTGAFITPSLVLTGKISVWMGLVSLVLMIIAVLLVAVMAAAVYESMLLFQGKRLRGKDVIALMKKQVVA